MNSGKTEKVWAFIACQTIDGDANDPIVRVFDNEAEALRHLDIFVNGRKGEREYAEKKGWEIDLDEPSVFRAADLDRYNFNYTEAEVRELRVSKKGHVELYKQL